MLWAITAGYARCMVPESLKGKAVAFLILCERRILVLKKTTGFLFDIIVCGILYFFGVTALWNLELQLYPMVKVNPKNYILIFFAMNCLITFLIHSRFYYFGEWFHSRKMNLKQRTKKIIISISIVLALLPVILSIVF